MVKLVNVPSSLVLKQDLLVLEYLHELIKTVSYSCYINWINYINS